MWRLRSLITSYYSRLGNLNTKHFTCWQVSFYNLYPALKKREKKEKENLSWFTWAQNNGCAGSSSDSVTHVGTVRPAARVPGPYVPPLQVSISASKWLKRGVLITDTAS